MKKYFIFILILTIMTISTVKGETTTNFIEAWSTNEQTIYNEEYFEFAGLFSNKSTAYNNGFLVTSVNFEKIQENEELETSLFYYDENGKILKSTIVKDAFILELATINDYIYALKADVDSGKITIIKYSNNLEKILEIETDYNISTSPEDLYYFMYLNIKQFETKENNLYVITSDGSTIIEYNQDLTETRELTLESNLEEVCSVFTEYCNFIEFGGNPSLDYTFIGYDSRDHFEIYTGFYSIFNIVSVIKTISDDNEHLVVGASKWYFSPRIMKDYVAMTSGDSISIADFNGVRYKEIFKKNTTYLYLSSNPNKNFFMVTEITTTKECDGDNNECITIKNTVYKESLNEKETDTRENILSSANMAPAELIETNDGSYVVIGNGTVTDIEGLENKGNEDAIVVKYNQKNEIVWIQNFGGSLDDYYNQATPTNDGGFVAVGYSESTDIEGIENKGEEDAIIVKYNKDGQIEWQQNWGGNSTDKFTSIASLKDGGYIVTGLSHSSNIEDMTERSSNEAIIIRYDEKGNILNQFHYEYKGIPIIDEVKATSDGGYVIGGGIAEYPDEDENITEIAFLVKFNNEDKEEWKYLGSSSSSGIQPRFREIEVLADDSIVGIEICFKTATIKIISSTGELIESRDELSGPTGEFLSMSTLPDGDGIVLVKGVAQTIANVSDMSNIEQIGQVVTTEVYKLTLDCTEKLLVYNLAQVEAEYKSSLNPSDRAIFNAIINKEGNLVISGSTKKTTDTAEENLALLFSQVTFDYFIDKEETTNGTYEVTKENGKGIITINPEKGYILDTLTITNSKGEQIEFFEKDGKYYFDLKDNVKVNVTYKEEIITNPNTITFLKLGFIAVLIFAIYNLFISKKLKINRYA